MRILSFAIYYIKLRVGTLLGLYNNHGPLNLKWRWETWHRLRKAQRKYASAGTFHQIKIDLTRIWKMLFS